MNEQKLKQRWLKEDEAKIDSAVSKAIADSEGRKFLWWLLEIGRIGNQPYSGNALNTAFACGELNVGQRILDRIISVSPEGYLTMMKESNDECKERDKLLDNSADDVGEDDGEVDERAGRS
jgi:hypothetical protein